MRLNPVTTDDHPRGTTRPAQIHDAYDEVAGILEDVDLAAEPELGDEIIAALAALDRAYTKAVEDGAATD